MAKETTVKYLDDLDGTEAAHPNEGFAVDGKSYLIDLSEQNKTKLLAALAPFVAAARRTGKHDNVTPIADGRKNRKAKAASSAPVRDDNAEVREWAHKWGLKCNDRGRIPQGLLDAYDGRDSRTGGPASNETWPTVTTPEKPVEPEKPDTGGEPKVNDEKVQPPAKRHADDAADYAAAKKQWRLDKGFSTKGTLSKEKLALFEYETGILPPLKKTG